MEYVNVTLCRVGKISCFGCCGHNFGSNQEIILAIKKNGFDFEDKVSLLDFMNRDNTLRDCGVCKNLIRLSDGTIGCPGHPKQTPDGVELRKCDILFECKKSYLFRNEWDENKRHKFLNYIQSLDSVNYSIFMSKNEDWFD